MAVDSGHIYWGDHNTGTIGRANIDGTEVEPEWIEEAGEVCGVAVSASHIYWTDMAGYVGFAKIDGSALSVTHVSGFTPCGVAVDAGHVYYMANSGSSFEIRRAGLETPGQTIDTLPATPTGECGLAVGPGKQLFWTNGGPNSSKTSGLWTIPTESGAPVFLAATEPEPWSVAVDATYAYWTTYQGGPLNRVRVDGTAPPEKVLATGIQRESVGLAVDALPLPAPPVEPTPPGSEGGGGSGSPGGGSGGSGSTTPSPGSPTPTAPPPTAKPAPKPLVCKKGTRRKVVKGKPKCVKVKKHKHRRHHHAKAA